MTQNLHLPVVIVHPNFLWPPAYVRSGKSLQTSAAQKIGVKLANLNQSRDYFRELVRDVSIARPPFLMKSFELFGDFGDMWVEVIFCRQRNWSDGSG